MLRHEFWILQINKLLEHKCFLFTMNKTIDVPDFLCTSCNFIANLTYFHNIATDHCVCVCACVRVCVAADL